MSEYWLLSLSSMVSSIKEKFFPIRFWVNIVVLHYVTG